MFPPPNPDPLESILPLPGVSPIEICRQALIVLDPSKASLGPKEVELEVLGIQELLIWNQAYPDVVREYIPELLPELRRFCVAFSKAASAAAPQVSVRHSGRPVDRGLLPLAAAGLL